MSLSDIKHWVFDMDGTLTVAVHDFAAIRVALEIPPEDDILTHLAALPADVAATKHAWLLEHERELAPGSGAAEGAVALVRELAGRGYRLGILTRPARELAHVTLEAIGLADCFAIEDVLGRDDAQPKPDPDGLLKLAAAWDVAPPAASRLARLPARRPPLVRRGPHLAWCDVRAPRPAGSRLQLHFDQ